MSFLSGIGDLFGGNNAGNQAMDYYNQIPDILKQYLKPYVDRGNAVYPSLQQHTD